MTKIKATDLKPGMVLDLGVVEAVWTTTLNTGRKNTRYVFIVFQGEDPKGIAYGASRSFNLI